MSGNLKQEFSQIYDDCIDKIYRFVYFKVNSDDVAQDICSEAFLRGWQAFKSEKKVIDNPQAFLYQIARNLVIDHYREKGKSQKKVTHCVCICIQQLCSSKSAGYQSNCGIFMHSPFFSDDWCATIPGAVYAMAS